MCDPPLYIDLYLSLLVWNARHGTLSGIDTDKFYIAGILKPFDSLPDTECVKGND